MGLGQHHQHAPELAGKCRISGPSQSCQTLLCDPVPGWFTGMVKPEKPGPPGLLCRVPQASPSTCLPSCLALMLPAPHWDLTLQISVGEARRSDFHTTLFTDCLASLRQRFEGGGAGGKMFESTELIGGLSRVSVSMLSLSK